MAEWCKRECRPFELRKTVDGWYYQAVGTKDNREEIQANQIIDALDDIAISRKNGDKEIKGIRLWYCEIKGNLDIKDAKKLEEVTEDDDKYIKLPNVELLFLRTVFNESVDFRSAKFEGRTSFEGERTDFSSKFEGETSFGNAKFEGETYFRYVKFRKKTTFKYTQFGERTDFSNAVFGKADFEFAQFGEETYFTDTWFGEKISFGGAKFGEITCFGFAKFVDEVNCSHAKFESPANFWKVKYWSDSPRVSIARWFWKDGKILKRILFLPKSSPEGKPREPTQFYLDSQNIDEVSNPHFKRYVADQQFIRSFKENHKFIYYLWKITSNCGRSMSLWLIVSVFLAGLFGIIYWLGFNGCFVFTDTQLGKTPHWYDYFYYSIITFTTLGFGDIVPSQPLAKFVVALEVFLGYTMLGGLISIFANKLARRS